MRIGLIGDESVGKSCFVARMVDDNFFSSYVPTIGVDFKFISTVIDDALCKTQIWDTAGQERSLPIATTVYKCFMGIMLLYDCTNEHSFHNIQTWSRRLKSHCQEDAITVLISNKSDCFERRVSAEEGEALAQDLGCRFFECSAKSGVNVEEATYFLVKQIIDKRLYI